MINLKKLPSLPPYLSYKKFLKGRIKEEIDKNNLRGALKYFEALVCEVRRDPFDD